MASAVSFIRKTQRPWIYLPYCAELTKKGISTLSHDQPSGDDGTRCLAGTVR